MAFKGYASKGKFSNYALNLPIAEEINEDLRVAGDKVRDIQLIAQQKHNNAQEYIGALNHKFKVEQENRDENDKWFQSNFKRIYEGEQREFKAKMAELQQAQAMAARKPAEKSTLEKALPHVLKLVQLGGQFAAAQQKAQQIGAAETIQNTKDRLNDADLSILDLDRFNAQVEQYQAEGLSKSASFKAATELDPKVGALLQENPNLLPDFNNAIGITPNAAAIARAQAYAAEAQKRFNWELTKPDSNLSRTRDGGAKDWGETQQIFREEWRGTLYNIANSEDPNGAGKEAIDELMKNPAASQILSKARSNMLNSLNKDAHKNITAANLEDYENDHLTHLGNVLRSDGVDSFVELSRTLYWEEKPNGNKLGEADYIINAIEKLGLSPADAVQIRAAFQKGHTSEIHDQSVMGKKWVDLDNRLGNAVSAKFRMQQNMQTIAEHKMLQEFATLGAGEKQAWYEGSVSSGQFQTFKDTTKRAILSSLGRQGDTTAQRQSANPLSLISTTGKKEMATAGITQSVRALGNNQTSLVIGADITDEVVSDTNRHFLNFHSQNPTAVERDPTTYYKLALKEALKEQEWSVEGTKAKGIVGLTSRPSPIADQDESVQRDQLRNVKNGDYGDYFEVNHGARTRIEGVKEALRGMDINTLTPQQIEHRLYSGDVTRAWDIARQTDRFATRGSVLQDMLNSVDGPNVDISHVITSREQAKEAYERGFNGYGSTVSNDIHRGAPISNSSYIGDSGGTVGTAGAGNTTGAHLHLETGDGYTGAGDPIPDYVLNEVYAGDKPLSAYIVTSGIGPRESPGGVGSTNHKGIDLAIPHGTPLTIKPGSDLQVTERDDKTRTGYGYVTIIRNTKTNKPFLLGHLSNVGGN